MVGSKARLSGDALLAQVPEIAQAVLDPRGEGVVAKVQAAGLLCEGG